MKKAFTLIELLVVIAIIAVLTGIVMASFSQAKSKSRDAERISEIAQIQLAIQIYLDRCGQYPNAITPNGPDSKIDLASSVGCPSGVTLGTFMSQLPVPPSTPSGNDYKYRYIVRKAGTINSEYYLGVRLENHHSALDDDIDSSMVGGSGDSRWSGYAPTQGSTGGWFNANEDPANKIYIYVVTSK